MPRVKKTIAIIPPRDENLDKTLSIETIKELPPTVDRVNNQLQKERAAYEAGLTRKKILTAIIDGLNAEIEVEEFIDGKRTVTYKPDMDKRLKAADMGAKYFGDMKEHSTVVGNVTHNKVIYMWKEPMTVVQVNNV